MQQVDHRPQMTPFFDVHLKQVSQVIHARTSLSQPSLLLDTGRFRVPLSDDQPAQLVAEFPGHLLPDRLTEEIPEADATVVRGVGQEDAPAILRQLYVFEMRPPGWIDADSGTHVDLVVILEPLRAHVFPPLDVFRLPVLERALESFVARKADVVGNLLRGNHGEPRSADF
jgi:hypothetical protein